MEEPKDTKGKQQNQGTNNYALAQSQYTRLGYFLTASAFLVVAFITLVTAEKNISVWLTHFVALLGSLIAAGYTFMNWWLTKGKDVQLLHTWGIPLIFFLFWIMAWYVVTHCWVAFTVIILFPASYIFQKYLRSPKEERNRK